MLGTSHVSRRLVGDIPPPSHKFWFVAEPNCPALLHSVSTHHMRAFSFEGRPRRTSGAAYIKVPAKAAVDEKNSARDRPMSETLARPSSVSRILEGFTSLLNTERHVSGTSASGNVQCAETASSCARTLTCATRFLRMTCHTLLHCQCRSYGNLRPMSAPWAASACAAWYMYSSVSQSLPRR